MIAVAALGTWVAGVGVGLVLFRRWPRPPATAWVHLVTALSGLALWIGYLVADRPGWLAWVGFAWLTLVNGLGDKLMLRRGGGYVAAAADVLSGRRPLVLVHALLAPATYVLVLVAALRG